MGYRRPGEEGVVLGEEAVGQGLGGEGKGEGESKGWLVRMRRGNVWDGGGRVKRDKRLDEGGEETG